MDEEKKDLDQNETTQETEEKVEQNVDAAEEKVEETKEETTDAQEKETVEEEKKEEETPAATEEEKPNSFEVNSSGEIVIDNTQDVATTPAPVLDRTVKVKEPMDKKKKIMIISIAVAAIIVIFSAIFFPCYFYYKDKIMVASAEDFVAEEGKYFFLKKDIEVDNLDLSNSNCSIDLNGHTLTVKKTLTLSTSGNTTIEIGTRKKGEYTNKGTLVVDNLVVTAANASFNFAIPVTIANSASITTKNLTLNGMSVVSTATITSENVKLNGKITVADENTTVTFNNCAKVTIADSIEASNVDFTGTNNIQVNKKANLNNIKLSKETTAQIYGTVESINGGKKVAMLAENICSNYEDVKLLAIYKPDTTEDLYIKNCEKFIRLDKLSAPKDLIVNETNGTFILTTAKIDEAKEYKILINGEFFNNTTDGTYDLTSYLASHGASTYKIQVFALGDYNFDTLEEITDGTAYMDASEPVSYSYEYTLKLTTPSNVEPIKDSATGNVKLYFDKVNYADYFVVKVDNQTVTFKTSELEEAADGRWIADISTQVSELGYHSIKIAAYSNSAQIIHSKDALTSYKTTKRIELTDTKATATYTVENGKYVTTITVDEVEGSSIFEITVGDNVYNTTLNTLTITTDAIPTIKIKALANGFYTESEEVTITATQAQ